MLENQLLIEQLESGEFHPLDNKFFGKRDRKKDFVGELQIIINPSAVSYEKSNWVTLLAVPKRIAVNGYMEDCNLQIGDKVMVRPNDGISLFDLAEYDMYEQFLYSNIEAIILKDTDEILPASGRVLVKMVEDEKKTAGGLWLPDTIDHMVFRNDTGKGIVISINNDVAEDVGINDLIHYEKNRAARFMEGNDNFLLVKVEHILAVEGAVE